MDKKGWLILEDGSVFEGGRGIGSEKETVCEFVFNTGMTGHCEILADPVCAGLGVITAFPVIGSWGAAVAGKGAARRGAEALICREISFCPPNNVKAQDINDFMIAKGITGLQGIDTRQLTRRIREKGSMRGAITFKEGCDTAAVLKAVRAYKARGLVESATGKCVEKMSGAGNVAVLDMGAPYKAAAALQSLRAGVTIYPAGTDAETILKDKPSGIIISEGPGDPADCGAYVPAVIKIMESGVPVFGIGLGHQLMAAAKGFKTIKLPRGHRGANYPVRETATGKIYITGQNHGYAVSAASVKPAAARISYTNLHDGSVEGIEYLDGCCASLQYFPETGPYALRPNAAFTRFLDNVNNRQAGTP